jgi:hypothetical protein
MRISLFSAMRVWTQHGSAGRDMSSQRRAEQDKGSSGRRNVALFSNVSPGSAAPGVTAQYVAAHSNSTQGQQEVA